MSAFSIGRLPRTFRSFGRVREIVAVVARWGFDDLAVRLDLESTRDRLLAWLPGRGDAATPDLSRLTTEERIRRALEELGPTFVKLGQILATRPDLIPMSLVRELRRLQDDVPPFASELARRTIEQELGRPISELFASFEDRALAAASIAQVHEARLHSGERVAVKVCRPGLERTVTNDLEILRMLAELVETNVPESRQFGPMRVVEEFARAITREIDLRNELANYERFAALFADDPFIHVPRTHRAFSTSRVLVVEFIDGVKVSSAAGLDAMSVDRKALARRATEFVVVQVFQHGFFHADPHPGNIFILPGPRIAPIDMGMMGSLDRDTIDDLLELLIGLLMRDASKVVRLFQRRELVEDDVDEAALRREVQELLDRYWAKPLGEVDIGQLIQELFDVLTRHRVTVPPELFLMGKALATVEGVARELDPGLDPLDAMRPRILRLYLERLADPRYLARDWLRVADEAVTALAQLPGDARRIVRDVRHGRLQLVLRQDAVRDAARDQARAANRLSLALVVSALLVGSSLLIALGGGPLVLGVPIAAWLGIAGLASAGSGFLVLALGALRSGNV